MPGESSKLPKTDLETGLDSRAIITLMSTLLKDGKRRCDGVCHFAVGKKCGCICGGKYHGSALTNPAILQQVSSNQRAIAHMLDEAAQPRLPLGEASE